MLQYLQQRDTVEMVVGKVEPGRVHHGGVESVHAASRNGLQVGDAVRALIDTGNAQGGKGIEQRPEKYAPATADVEQMLGGEVVQ